MRLPGIALVAGLAPLLIAAQTPAVESVSAPKTDAVAAKADEVVCKKFDPPTGSRIGKRQICKTKAQWDYIQDQEQEAIDRALRKPFDGQ